jgi:hypothetical protein
MINPSEAFEPCAPRLREHRAAKLRVGDLLEKALSEV